jgi:hypothetical protein
VFEEGAFGDRPNMSVVLPQAERRMRVEAETAAAEASKLRRERADIESFFQWKVAPSGDRRLAGINAEL